MIGKLDLAETVADGAAMIALAGLAAGGNGKVGASASAGAAGWSTGSPSPPGDALEAGVSFYGPAPDPARGAAGRRRRC